MTIQSDRLRVVMRQWTSGVSLVTSTTDGRIHGMTVSSFVPLSLDPPQVLVSLARTTRTHKMVSECGLLAVVFLAEDQADLSNRFAGLTPDQEDRFRDIAFSSTPNGCPLPEGVLAYLDCEVVTTFASGTHTAFIGEVQSGEVLRQTSPLVYHNRSYRPLDETGDRPTRD
jgi:flavin reductase (DIM6/NTAB) family NADH-FMN oxidoreductase RutF